MHITLILLPHGSIGLAIIIQQTLLPWYIASKEDLMILETEKSRLFQNIIKVNQNLEMLSASLLGHVHCYDIIFFWFSAVVVLTNLGVLFDALVCRWQ